MKAKSTTIATTTPTERAAAILAQRAQLQAELELAQRALAAAIEQQTRTHAELVKAEDGTGNIVVARQHYNDARAAVGAADRRIIAAREKLADKHSLGELTTIERELQSTVAGGLDAVEARIREEWARVVADLSAVLAMRNLLRRYRTTAIESWTPLPAIDDPTTASLELVPELAAVSLLDAIRGVIEKVSAATTVPMTATGVLYRIRRGTFSGRGPGTLVSAVDLNVPPERLSVLIAQRFLEAAS